MTDNVIYGYHESPVPSLRDYIRRDVTEDTLAQMPPEIRASLEATWDRLETEYLSNFQPGDEWFQWQHMTNPLCGSGGLELRRNGERVRVWVNWVA